MTTVDLTAGTVMDKSASLMNDTAKTTYTYTAQLPYLQIALQELQEYFELHGVPVTDEVSAVIQVNAGYSEIVFGGVAPTPALPSDLIEPIRLWERERGIDPYVPMTRRNFLPHQLEGVTTTQFVFWCWQKSKIVFLPANRNNDIKMDYTRQIFTDIVNESSPINCINARTFLEYRTAGLVAEFIERNKPSADALNQFAALAIDRSTGITVRGTQSIVTRRKPFRAAYKKRGWMT